MKKISLPLLLILSCFILNSQAQSQYELLYLTGDFNQILEKSAVLADSGDYYWNALALNNKGDVLEAIKTLEAGLEKYTMNKQLEQLYLDLLFKTGQYAKSKPLMLKYMASPAIFMKLIRTYEFESDYTAAIHLLEERIHTDSLNLEYLSRLGDNYLQVERDLSAREIFTKVVKLNPGDISALAKLANIYLRTQVYSQAIYLCNKALQRDPENRTVIKIKGLAAFRQGDTEIAEDCFSYLLEQGDSSIVILKHLGISEVKNFADNRSYEHLLLAYKQDTTDHEVCYFLGRSCINNGIPDVGIYYLDLADTLLQPKPGIEAVIIAGKASAYTAMKEYEKAMACYEKAYKIKPNPEYLFFMASLNQHRLKNKKRALSYYQLFIDSLESVEVQKSGIRTSTHTISLKRTAELNIERLKEEMFFTGELSRDSLPD